MLSILFVYITHDVCKTTTSIQDHVSTGGISACNYAPGMLKVAMLRSSYVSITSVVKSDSRDTVGDATLSSFTKYLFCLLPSYHFLPLIVPSLFCLMKFAAFSALDLSSADKISGSITVTTFFPGIDPSSNCLSYFIMADIARSPNKSKYCVACICIYIIFTAHFMDASKSYFVFSFTSFFVLFIRNCTFFFILSYNLPVNVGSKREIPSPALSLVGCFYVCDVSSYIYVSFMINSVSFTFASSYLE